MSKTLAEQMDELNAAVGDARRVLLSELATTRLGRFFGWFYEWERVRIGDRFAKAATILLALQPVFIIEKTLSLLSA